ncbi:oxidoreductase domain protein [Pseudarthrobacter chlorophenolicus A6]|uniref:Oxidoreductase domain protein n=1 Tax=Pseudarthrobacter chlorophenolicus (strain ATCC 700700 / DSM 12829 / CIP 107037 / JCM 12360 / KCTC 9906 / NCIMB 13794 / A6) TaxID=452863 RepID=B8HC64_PSECP|nr:Gfo/Idh/MocA family oxidoreductase [Pseudarthrobacter chlorophenolicus]ACL38774.1 oxidoreductase domain protein [Pseudarthrobacter chlorophenolicus A6]SDR08925.1 Predicted dehydrogenase [Pseudarthrobacter chlorophenolicus]
MTTAAIIGCGDVSSVHFAALASMPDAELVAVCDTHPGRLAAAEAAHGVAGYADHRELLRKVRPDVVHICTPHHLHASLAIDCLDAGVNVIVEKPLAHTLEEGRKLVAAAARGTAKIGVCFQNRYNATSVAMRELLDGGTLGRVLGASATVMWHRTADYYRDRPWRGTWDEGGGGLMMNQAIHTVDLLQWLVGDVAKVEGHASVRALAGIIEVEDTAEFAAEHANGARSVFYATLGNAVNAPVTLDITTEKALLSLRGDLTVTYGDGAVEVVSEPVPESGRRSYWGASHELLIRDFYAKLEEPGPFWINPAEAGKSLQVVKDIYAQSYPQQVERVS